MLIRDDAFMKTILLSFSLFSEMNTFSSFQKPLISLLISKVNKNIRKCFHKINGGFILYKVNSILLLLIEWSFCNLQEVAKNMFFQFYQETYISDCYSLVSYKTLHVFKVACDRFLCRSLGSQPFYLELRMLWKQKWWKKMIWHEWIRIEFLANEVIPTLYMLAVRDQYYVGVLYSISDFVFTNSSSLI